MVLFCITDVKCAFHLRENNSPGHLATLITARNFLIISRSFSLILRLDEDTPPAVCDKL